MDWILLIGSIASAWAILSILANERESRVNQQVQIARRSAAQAAERAAEIPVVR
jgi:hypothetical protein